MWATEEKLWQKKTIFIALSVDKECRTSSHHEEVTKIE